MYVTNLFEKCIQINWNHTSILRSRSRHKYRRVRRRKSPRSRSPECSSSIHSFPLIMQPNMSSFNVYCQPALPVGCESEEKLEEDNDQYGLKTEEKLEEDNDQYGLKTEESL